MKKQKEGMTFATEILSTMKRQLIRCRVALIVTLAGNVMFAAASGRLRRKGKML